MSPRAIGHATLAVLQAISDGVQYGFDIIDRTGLPSGTVYPALATLERRGLVDSKGEAVAVAQSDGRPRRRYYRLTAEGRTELAAALRRLESLGLVGSKRMGGSAEGSPA